MPKIFSGYFLTGLGITGFLYFRHYKGVMISYPYAWQWLSCLIGIAGIYITVNGQKNAIQQTSRKPYQNRKKIVLTPDNCQVRENNYYEEETDNSNSRMAVFDALYDANRNHSSRFIEQSAIIYYDESTGRKIKMTSQSFPFNAEKLSSLIRNGEVVLLINRFDSNDYTFELMG